jgi:hypothetical protein
MNSNTDGDFTTTRKKTNKRNSLQQQQEIDNISISSNASSTSSTKKKNDRRKTFNIIFKPSTSSLSIEDDKNSNIIDLDEIKKSWKVGTLVEARDLHDNWYKSRIIGHDELNKRVKVHFFGWNSRYDQWFNLCSNDVRPLPSTETVPTVQATIIKKQEAPEELNMKFNVGEKILAKWIDSFHYPATVLRSLKKNNTIYYEVKFEDGVKKMIRYTNCKVYDQVNDIVVAKPAEQPVEIPAIEDTSVDAADESSGNIRKSSRVKRQRTFSTDEILPVVARRQSVGVNKKRKLNELVEIVEIPVKIEEPPVAVVVADVSTPPKMKKLPLGEYFKTLSLFKSNKKRSKTVNIHAEEVVDEEDIKIPAQNDVKFHVSTNNESNSSIKLKISKLFTLKSEPNEVKQPEIQPVFVFQQQQQLSSPPMELIRCKFSNCDKTFRKQHLLDYHIKYHHYEDGRIIEVVTKKRKLTQNEDFDSSFKESKKIKIDEKVEEECDPYEVIHCKCEKNISVGFMIQVYFLRKY